ncbi:MAG: hypothetical protein MSH21_08995 [Clostridium sp.]|uniref:hypothetical protein n=1 Tax=Butyribacter sp. TaxID=2822465 RepID=UPI002A9999D0|nr:hypothetical protein [Clostridium sp.]MDY5180822.1 hypothetical protein [Butyribacter sp.]
MFRLWAKKFKDNRMLDDITITDQSKEKNRTKKVFDSLDEVCYAFDLGRPIWLDKNIKEFKKMDKTRFDSDNFIEEIDFDYLEIHVIEEDEIWE